MTQNLFAGVSAKYLHKESLVHVFTSRELVEHQDDLSSYIRNELREDGDALGFDAGLLWKLAPKSKLRPSFGISVMNIGDLDFGRAGKIPHGQCRIRHQSHAGQVPVLDRGRGLYRCAGQL